MTSDLTFIARAYLPVVTGALLGLLAWKFEDLVSPSEGSAKLTLRIGFAEVAMPATQLARSWAIRPALAFTGVALCAWGLLLDVSSFLPSELRMDVYFDMQGLERAVSGLPSQSLEEAGLARDWRERVPQYEETVRQRLLQEWADDREDWEDRAATVNRQNLRARGETSYIVERTGWLTYRLTGSDGRLLHTVAVALLPALEFETRFELKPTAHDIIRGSIANIFGARIVLQHNFTQALFVPRRRVAGELVFDHTVTSMTALRAFPLPRFGNTAYLWRAPDGALVPIAYAVYY